MSKCAYCGSSNLLKGLSPNADGPLALYYHASGTGAFGGRVALAEALLCDLCQDCGSVRLYVQNLDREWVQ